MIMLFDTKVSVCPLPVVALRLNKRRAFHDFFIGKTRALSGSYRNFIFLKPIQTTMKGITILFILYLFSVQYKARKTSKSFNSICPIKRMVNRFRERDFKDLLITDESYSRQIEADHIYVNQTFEGLEILNSGGVFVVKNGEVIYSSRCSFITDVQNKTQDKSNYKISAQDAIDFCFKRR